MIYEGVTMKNKVLISVMVILAIAGTAAAAANDSELLKPGMGQAWLNSMGTDVQDVYPWRVDRRCYCGFCPVFRHCRH